MNRGKYIVLEGPEGVGKTTQLQELARRLQAAGLPVRLLREPDSQSDLTARALRQLTQDPRYPMNTNTEVLLYNAARSQSLQIIRQSVEQGIICLVDRNYLTTLAIQYYGRGDVPDYETINRIISFAVNGVEPDLCIVLDAPVQTLKERARARGQGERFDNLDDAFLERVRAGYLWEAKQRDLPVVFATEDTETIANAIWKLVADTLATREQSKSATTAPVSVKQIIEEKQQQVEPVEPPMTMSAKQPGYYVPPKLNKDAADTYKKVLGKLTANYEKLRAAFEADDAGGQAAARLVLPVAALRGGDEPPIGNAPQHDSAVAALAKDNLQEGLDGNGEPEAVVTDYWPRSELSAVPQLLFGYTNSPLARLAAEVDRWPYERKAEVVTESVKHGSAAALASIGYTWELMTTCGAAAVLKEQPDIQIELQQLTPRYGYDVPAAIEKAGLTEMFEECFDASLELYSKLQAAGHTSEAQYATLLGHRVRCKLSMSAAGLRGFVRTTDPALRPIANLLTGGVAGVHPLIGDALKAA